MRQTNRISSRWRGIEVLAATILLEILRADVTMLKLQLNAWRGFLDCPTKSAYSSRAIKEGIHPNKFLFLNDVRLALHVRPLFATSILSRIKTAWQVLTGKLNDAGHLNGLAICAATDPQAVPLSLRVMRSEQGEVSVRYRAADRKTKALMSMKRYTL